MSNGDISTATAFSCTKMTFFGDETFSNFTWRSFSIRSIFNYKIPRLYAIFQLKLCLSTKMKPLILGAKIPIWVESKRMHTCQISRHFPGSLQTLIVNLILKRFLRNLRDMSKFSSQSVKMLFIRYRVSQKYGGKGFLS